MVANIGPLIAKVLIQVGADEPKEIGTIEIPINVSIVERPDYGSIPAMRADLDNAP